MDKKIFTMQIDRMTRTALQKLARANDRSMAAQVRVLIHKEACVLDKVNAPTQIQPQQAGVQAATK